MRRYVIVFQCAARPGARVGKGYPGVEHHQIKKSDELKKLFGPDGRYKGEESEWTFKEEDVRPYGILLADADEFEARFPGAQCGEWGNAKPQGDGGQPRGGGGGLGSRRLIVSSAKRTSNGQRVARR